MLPLTAQSIVLVQWHNARYSQEMSPDERNEKRVAR